jgi:hypothetical protein
VVVNGQPVSKLGTARASAGEVSIEVPPGQHTFEAPYRL